MWINRRQSSTAQGGFTLLEVLIAAVLFTLIMGAVYSTFRTALGLYKAGTSQRELSQEARILHSITMRDLRSVLGIDETSYDIAPYQKDTTQNIDYSTDTSWIQDETTYSQAEYDFVGNATTMTFYSYGSVPLGKLKVLRQGIFKITYTYEDKKLNRKVDEQTGTIAEDEDLVHGIKSCELSYGYKKAGQLFWASKWDSRLDNNRTPKDAEEEDSLFDPERKDAIRVYPDNLPDAVRIKMTLEIPDNPKAEGEEFDWFCEIPSTKPSIVKEATNE